MTFFRLILYIILFYFGYHFFKGLFGKRSNTEVQGQRKSKPLDLSNSDIEDAKFEDITDDEQ